MQDNMSNVIDWSKQPVEFWRTKTYLICAYRNHCNEIERLAIRRHDWEPCSDWRDKQAIKNQIVGPEWEAVELYPAESRVQDKGNWFHLWVMPNGARYPSVFPKVVTVPTSPPRPTKCKGRSHGAGILAHCGELQKILKDFSFGQKPDRNYF